MSVAHNSGFAKLHKIKIIKLFRNLLRERLGLPTENRREYILIKTRQEFRKAKNETDPRKLKSLLIIGNTQLDTVMIQAKHLSSILDREPTEFEQRNNINYNYFEKLKGERIKDPQEDKTLIINRESKKWKPRIKPDIEDGIN